MSNYTFKREGKCVKFFGPGLYKKGNQLTIPEYCDDIIVTYLENAYNAGKEDQIQKIKDSVIELKKTFGI